MRNLNSASVDLIYLDPPFNSKANYAAPIGSQAAGAEFKDTWTFTDLDEEWLELMKVKHPALIHIIQATILDSDKSYLIYMAVRIIEMHRILKNTGSIYLHCDPTMSHYLKLIMDALFGRKNFRNEIVWSYQRWTGATKHFQRMHDVLLFYVASADASFNVIKEPYSSKSKHKGRRMTSFRDGAMEQQYTEDTSRMKARRDVWEISYLNSQSKERTGYPTQKPLKLLNWIIEASSNEGDMVFDPFCGCATTCVSAEGLGRQWIGIDISPKAAELVKLRTKDVLGTLLGDIVHRTDIPQRTDMGKNCQNTIILKTKQSCMVTKAVTAMDAIRISKR